MTYVIAAPCIDVMDRGCVEECPVDCIYEGARSLYIHPDECIDCGACEPVCPVEAISYESDVPARWEEFIDDNAHFFHRLLPGAAEIVGSPGGSMNLGRVGVDTELVGGYPHSNHPNIGRHPPRGKNGNDSRCDRTPAFAALPETPGV